jgi:hypothetical protein
MGAFKKGDLLRVVMDGGARGGDMYPRGVRVLTAAERERLAVDPWYRELDSAGEPRLVPRHRVERIDPGTLVTVLRARGGGAPRARGWSQSGHVLVLDPSSGNELYIKRHFLEAIPAPEEGEK